MANRLTDEGLLDTSVFIASEAGRDLALLPAVAAISVVTVSELYMGVLMADDPEIRERRLRTLSTVENGFEPLPVDISVARTFSEIASEFRRNGRPYPIMDCWIAATALVHHLPLYTQERDFIGISRLEVVIV